MLLRILKSHMRGLSVVVFTAAIYLVAAQGSQSLPPRHVPKAKRAAIHVVQSPQILYRCLSIWQVPLKPDTTETANALLAAQAINDFTVAHGEVFSFNTAVGPRTRDRGYQSGAMFQSGQLIYGIGGGICYVSTALYNAALEAGLPLITRSPHSGIVRYAPPGRDSAVSPDTDLQFKNDTGNPLTIRVRADDEKLTVSIWGVRPTDLQVQVLTQGYKKLMASQTSLEDPALAGPEPSDAQTCRDGYECTIVRKIIKDGKLVWREAISHDIHPATNGVKIASEDIPPMEPVTDDPKANTQSPTASIHVNSPEEPTREADAAKAAVARAVMRSLLTGASYAKQAH